MGLIRFIFVLLVLGVAWFVVKNYLRRKAMHAQRVRARNEPPQIAGRIVRCKHCDIHLPESEAVRDGDDWFCSQAHRQAWQARQRV